MELGRLAFELPALDTRSLAALSAEGWAWASVGPNVPASEPATASAITLRRTFGQTPPFMLFPSWRGNRLPQMRMTNPVTSRARGF
ncbi:hypothetical protein J2W46_003396 [Paraburkholderia strydomiana]|nr:hypothetical protein [Paraburkholderia strydomiana]